jgi:hypothetical protein
LEPIADANAWDEGIGYEFAPLDASRPEAEISNASLINLGDSRYAKVGLGHTHIRMQTQWGEMPKNGAVTNLDSSNNGHYSDGK